MSREFQAVKVMATAMEELRGLERPLIIEIEEEAGDIVTSCGLIEAVLKGFLRAPKDVQNNIVGAGIAPNEEFGKLVYGIMSDEKKYDNAIKTLQQIDVKNFDDYGEVDCPHWLW